MATHGIHTRQHARVLAGVYAVGRHSAPLPFSLRAEYVLASAWRGYRKTDTSKRFGRGVDHVHFLKKLAKKSVRVTIYTAAVTLHALRARVRRAGRRVYYEVAVLSHRVGLRRTGKESGPR
jgi:hypothetical protein